MALVGKPVKEKENHEFKIVNNTNGSHSSNFSQEDPCQFLNFKEMNAVEVLITYILMRYASVKKNQYSYSD